jgi:hypothetical protein
VSHWTTVYAGDPAKIAQAVRDEEDLDDAAFVVGSVELSGIYPEDTEALLELATGEARPFGAFVAEQVAGDKGGECGAYLMASTWTHALAALSDARVKDLVPAWLRALGDAENAESAAACTASLQELAELCRVAVRENVAVICYWSM